MDPIIEFGGGIALGREADVSPAMLLTRSATRKQHTPRHPDTNLTQISVPGCCVIWDVGPKHATYVMSCNMSPELTAKVGFVCGRRAGVRWCARSRDSSSGAVMGFVGSLRSGYCWRARK